MIGFDNFIPYNNQMLAVCGTQMFLGSDYSWIKSHDYGAFDMREMMIEKPLL